MDLAETIAPKSDQINAEDLLSGPRTVTVTEVRKGSAEQPVDIVTAEFGPARPFKPSKTVRRILVAAWGKDSDAYLGRRMTLFRDPDVRFGGQDVGGIRVSHLSHIDKPMRIALTVTRGKRAPYVVEPLGELAPAAPNLGPLFDAAGIADRAARLQYAIDIVGRDVKSPAELTPDEIAQVADSLRALQDQPSEPAEALL